MRWDMRKDMSGEERRGEEGEEMPATEFDKVRQIG